ncbi:MAG: TIGR03960 family B12-binding radical SAM protein [Clostridiales Family XIII bacterium]|jgi:radical SAM family uncharacterized protein|nr:TIGR03960 family B12-binding radical SAM protein [Clostridiales Family XIII bacterium]
MDRLALVEFLNENGVPEHVKRHCLAVGDAAVNIAAALTGAGFRKADGEAIDMEVVRIAGYLHDIARAQKDHDVAGGAIVRPLNERAGDVVARHMKLNFPDAMAALTEAEIVSLGDRTVCEDRYVGYEARMEELLARYAQVQEVVDRVHRNMGRALGLIAEIEAFCGRDFMDIAMGGAVDVTPLLRRVERPGRYIGGEVGSVKKHWGDAAVHFCFAFPDLYEIGMSYTGLQILYGLLNQQEGVLCERAFAPAADMEKALADAGAPLFSLESGMPVKRFDIVGFTLQYELSYTNVVRMLVQAGIPLRAEDRGEGDPVVLCGGPCCANPLPMEPFADLFCVGDGEDAVVALCEAYRASGGVRGAFLDAARGIAGVYVPGRAGRGGGATAMATDAGEATTTEGAPADTAPAPVQRARVEDLDAAFFPVRPVVPHIETVHERAAVEIMRGCYRSCRFCQAGYACADVRRRSPGKIKELLLAQLAHTGYDEASLLSLSTGDYPGIEALVTDLMGTLAEMDVALSLPSLRLDSLKPGTLERIAAYKATALTFAPEAGTQRLRDVIGKGLTEADLYAALDAAMPLGFSKFKFYFMIGLPTETPADLQGIADLAQALSARARAIAQDKGLPPRFHLSVSVSNFVPKPGTPFEREKGDSEEALMEKIYFLKDAIRRVKGVSFKYHDTRMSRVEMLLAKGDRRTADAIEKAALSGAGFDSWREHFDYENWLRAFADAGLAAEDRYAGEGAALPWAFIGQGKAYR